MPLQNKTRRQQQKKRRTSRKLRGGDRISKLLYNYYQNSFRPRRHRGYGMECASMVGTDSVLGWDSCRSGLKCRDVIEPELDNRVVKQCVHPEEYEEADRTKRPIRKQMEFQSIWDQALDSHPVRVAPQSYVDYGYSGPLPIRWSHDRVMI